MDKQTNFIFVFIGQFNMTSGCSFAAKALYDAIRSVNIPLFMVDTVSDDVRPPSPSPLVNVSRPNGRLSIRALEKETALVAVFHEPPDRYPQLDFDGKVRRIGLHYFDSKSYPAQWLEYALEMDEIWTDSQSAKTAFDKAGLPGFTIDVVPRCLDEALYRDQHSAMEIPGGKDFVFLTVVPDFNRPDTGMLLKTYFESFTAADDVTLVIKSNERKLGVPCNTQFLSDLLPEYDLDDPQLPHYLFINENAGADGMRSLYTACHAYIAIDRGSGWDLPALEAMAMSKPVIGISRSADSELTKPGNVLPVESDTTAADPQAEPNARRYSPHQWARVSDETLCDLLRHVFEDCEERERIACYSSEYIKKHHSLPVIGEAVKAKIESYASYDFYQNKNARLIFLRDSRKPASKIPFSDEDQRLIQVVMDEGRNLNGGYVHMNLHHKRMLDAYNKIRKEHCHDAELVKRAENFFSCPLQRVNRKRKKFALLHSYAVKIHNSWKNDKINIAQPRPSPSVPKKGKKEFQTDVLAPYREGEPLDAWVEQRRELLARGPVNISAHDVSHLQSLKNKYLNERIFMIGCGPSLNKIDFDKLRNEYTFGVSKIFLMSRRIDWYPTFYTCIDWRTGPDIYKEVNQMGNGTTFFFPNRFRGLYRDGDDVYWYWARGGGKRLADRFEPDITKGVAGQGTVMIPAIQMAHYMGFREMYLIGVDVDYKINKNVIQSGNDRFGTGVKIELTSTADDDPNHFDPSYFGAGAKWHDPNVDEIFRGFLNCRKGVELNGGKLYNAGIGGKLDVVERVDFDSLFE
ncbi:MAG: DUF115 domain-containing protein [bacterium]|nr:DUF115 domain-containing protein [bacterium]